MFIVNTFFLHQKHQKKSLYVKTYLAIKANLILIVILNSLCLLIWQKHRRPSRGSPRRTCCTPLPCPRTRAARSLTWGRCWPDTTHRAPEDGTGRRTSTTQSPKCSRVYRGLRWRVAVVYPKLCLVRNERVDVENAPRAPCPLLGLTDWRNEEVQGWCGGIKTAGGEVFVGAETPPPCPLPLKPEQRGERKVLRAARGGEVEPRTTRQGAQLTVYI